MAADLARLLSGFNRSAPAARAAIDACQRDLGVTLPAEYLDFLRQSDGGEGFIGGGAYLILWPAHQLASLNRAYGVHDFAPGLLLIGSNGGGEGFGFDTRSSATPIVMTPFVGLSWETAEPMGATFGEFVRRLANR